MNTPRIIQGRNPITSRSISADPFFLFVVIDQAA
jgi:hypothetical protein